MEEESLQVKFSHKELVVLTLDEQAPPLYKGGFRISERCLLRSRDNDQN